jgi:thioesterase domain-containing protein
LQAHVAGPSPDVLSESIRLAAATHPEVLDAHVEQQLIAARNEWCVWIVARDSQRGEPHDFREWLAARLPSAPRRIRAVPRLPLDESGSIDTAALADMLPEDVSAPPAKKCTEDEDRVRKAISRALGGRKIDIDEILTDGRTKPQVAKLLHEAVLREEPRVELGDFTTGFSVRSLLRNVRGRKSGADSKWTPLQPLRASGKLPPLVFIHDLDGTSKIYDPLVAQLGGDQPCYAITARGLADPAACHSSIVEMAGAYIEALRVFDASGPYRLVGYGFGGLVAFEMARQLTEAKAEVPLLILLAAEPPGGNSAMGFLAGGWKKILFGKKPPEEANGRRKTQETPASRANQEAARKYTAAPAPLLAHVFAPTEDFPAYRIIQNGWEACCAEVLLYQVPCSGPDMMQEPAVESLAETMLKLVRDEDLAEEVEPE